MFGLGTLSDTLGRPIPVLAVYSIRSQILALSIPDC